MGRRDAGFRDAIGNPAHRDAAAFSRSIHYVNDTGRNDVVASKVTFDADSITFYVRTKDALSPPTDPD